MDCEATIKAKDLYASCTDLSEWLGARETRVSVLYVMSYTVPYCVDLHCIVCVYETLSPDVILCG